MKRYLIESPHAAEDCEVAVRNVFAAGYITHFDWGCKAGVHAGWAIIEAESEAQAALVVPVNLRKKARILELIRYSPDDMHSG